MENCTKNTNNVNLGSQKSEKADTNISNLDLVYQEIKYNFFSDGTIPDDLEVYHLGSMEDKRTCIKDRYCNDPYNNISTSEEFNNLVDSLTDVDIDGLFNESVEFLSYKFYPDQTIGLLGKLIRSKNNEPLYYEELEDYYIEIPYDVYRNLIVSTNEKLRGILTRCTGSEIKMRYENE